MTDAIKVDNCFELDVPFPKRFLYNEIVYVDDRVKTSVNLMHKYNIKHFKALKVLHHPEIDGAALMRQKSNLN